MSTRKHGINVQYLYDAWSFSSQHYAVVCIEFYAPFEIEVWNWKSITSVELHNITGLYLRVQSIAKMNVNTQMNHLGWADPRKEWSGCFFTSILYRSCFCFSLRRWKTQRPSWISCWMKRLTLFSLCLSFPLYSM